MGGAGECIAAFLTNLFSHYITPLEFLVLLLRFRRQNFLFLFIFLYERIAENPPKLDPFPSTASLDNTLTSKMRDTSKMHQLVAEHGPLHPATSTSAYAERPKRSHGSGTGCNSVDSKSSLSSSPSCLRWQDSLGVGNYFGQKVT